MSRSIYWISLGVLGFAGLSCSGTESISAGTAAATLTFSITDKPPTEVVAFEIDLTDVEVRTKTGQVIPVFHGTQRLDLVELAEQSELIALVSMLPAQIDQLTLGFDYTSAECVLLGASAAAEILDGDGQALVGKRTYRIDVQEPFSASIGANHSIEIELGSLRALQIDTALNRVRCEPVPMVRVDRFDAKPLVLYGRLAGVDAEAGFFDLKLETLAGSAGEVVRVTSTSETLLQVEGGLAAGQDGLSALAATPLGSSVQVAGEPEFFARRFLAAYVEAGVGTRAAGQDVVRGQILARSGATGEDAILTVQGTGHDEQHGIRLHNSLFSVRTSYADTHVFRRGLLDPLTTDDLNVGQLVRIYGVLGGTTLDATASGGLATIEPTRIAGTAVAPPVGESFTIAIEHLGSLASTDIHWEDGGDSPPDPDAFVLKVNPLSFFLGISAGTRIEARGLFPAVANADQDFFSDVLINRTPHYRLRLHDRQGGITVTPAIDLGSPPDPPTSITLTFGGALGEDELAQLDAGYGLTQDLPLDMPLRVLLLPIPSDQLNVIATEEKVRDFAFRHRRTDQCRMFRAFAQTDPFSDETTQYQDFADRLITELARGATIYDIYLAGSYFPGDNHFEAVLATIVLD